MAQVIRPDPDDPTYFHASFTPDEPLLLPGRPSKASLFAALQREVEKLDDEPVVVIQGGDHSDGSSYRYGATFVKDPTGVRAEQQRHEGERGR
jgi:hypothetical protein